MSDRYAALPDGLREYVAAWNTPEARWAEAGAPRYLAQVTVDNITATDKQRAWLHREWIENATPQRPGLVLWGAVGRGKTGLALAILRARAEACDGDLAIWNLITTPRVRELRASGEYYIRPAPCWFTEWSAFRRACESARIGRLPWTDDEDRPMTVHTLVRDLDLRTSLLVLDDLDLGVISSWSEELLLPLLARPSRGERLILTMNSAPTEKRLGERIADRVLDNRVYTVLRIDGPSRRAK